MRYDDAFDPDPKYDAWRERVAKVAKVVGVGLIVFALTVWWLRGEVLVRDWTFAATWVAFALLMSACAWHGGYRHGLHTARHQLELARDIHRDAQARIDQAQGLLDQAKRDGGLRG